MTARIRGPRTESKKYAKLYSLPEYQAGREVFLAAHPLCIHCLRRGIETTSTIIDHRPPHKGDKRKFLDKRTWQPVCKQCHDTVSQRLDMGLPEKGCDESGWPLDPALRRGWEQS